MHYVLHVTDRAEVILRVMKVRKKEGKERKLPSRRSCRGRMEFRGRRASLQRLLHICVQVRVRFRLIFSRHCSFNTTHNKPLRRNTSYQLVLSTHPLNPSSHPPQPLPSTPTLSFLQCLHSQCNTKSQNTLPLNPPYRYFLGSTS